MRTIACWMFALLLAGTMACNKGSDESEEEGNTEASATEGEGEEEEAAEEEAPAAQIDPALVGHWAQRSGDVLTFNSLGRVHMGSSGCVGNYTAIDGTLRTTFENAGPNCMGSQFAYTIEGETLNWLTTFTRADTIDDPTL